MATSDILRLTLIANGDEAGTWGATTNTNLGTILEDAIAGYAAVSVTSAGAPSGPVACQASALRSAWSGA